MRSERQSTELRRLGRGRTAGKTLVKTGHIVFPAWFLVWRLGWFGIALVHGPETKFVGCPQSDSLTQRSGRPNQTGILLRRLGRNPSNQTAYQPAEQNNGEWVAKHWRADQRQRQRHIKDESQPCEKSGFLVLLT